MVFDVFEEWSYASPPTPYVLLAKDNCDLCLMNTSMPQRMFDEYFQASTNVDHQVHEAPALVPADSTT